METHLIGQAFLAHASVWPRGPSTMLAQGSQEVFMCLNTLLRVPTGGSVLPALAFYNFKGLTGAKNRKMILA